MYMPTPFPGSGNEVVYMPQLVFDCVVQQLDPNPHFRFSMVTPHEIIDRLKCYLKIFFKGEKKGYRRGIRLHETDNKKCQS